jgi:arylsulfatase A-like enzyme
VARGATLAAALGLTAQLLAGCGAETGSRPGPAAADRPSVLLIVVDTLRRDHLGAYGHPRSPSPNLDRLAADSVRYDDAVSQAPWTLPSVGSLLTSRQPGALGLTRFSSALGDDAVLLSELLQRHGYATGAVVSHRFCSSRWGFDQGFDVFDEDNARGHGAVTSPGVSDRALAFLDAHGERPFFLWLHYFDPHFDYLEHEGFGRPRDAAYEGPIRSGMEFPRLFELRGSLAPRDVDELRRIYESEIAFTDHHIGRVLDRLRESGRLERTVVVLTADHGEEFLEHGGLGHSRTLYQELLAVPLLVRIPGRAPGVVTSRVALLDVLPTVLAALSLPPASGAAGAELPAPASVPCCTATSS